MKTVQRLEFDLRVTKNIEDNRENASNQQFLITSYFQ